MPVDGAKSTVDSIEPRGSDISQPSHLKSTKIAQTLKSKQAMSLIQFKQFDYTKMINKPANKLVPSLLPIRQKISVPGSDISGPAIISSSKSGFPDTLKKPLGIFQYKSKTHSLQSLKCERPPMNKHCDNKPAISSRSFLPLHTHAMRMNSAPQK